MKIFAVKPKAFPRHPHSKEATFQTLRSNESRLHKENSGNPRGRCVVTPFDSEPEEKILKIESTKIEAKIEREEDRPVKKRKRGQVLRSIFVPSVSTELPNECLLSYQKLAPQALTKMVGMSKIEGTLTEWHSRKLKQDVIRNIQEDAFMLSGPVGTGKSHTGRLFLQKHGYHIIEFNCSSAGVFNQLKQITKKDSASQKPIGVLIDEFFEIWTRDPQIANVRCPAVVICTSNRQMPKFFFSNSAMTFSLDRQRSLTVLQNALSLTSRTMSNEEREDIVESSMGDARQIMIRLDFTSQRLGVNHAETLNPFEQVKRIGLRLPVEDLDSLSELLLEENIDLLGEDNLEKIAVFYSDMAFVDASRGDWNDDLRAASPVYKEVVLRLGQRASADYNGFSRRTVLRPSRTLRILNDQNNFRHVLECRRNQYVTENPGVLFPRLKELAIK